jgi:hypothetical protein
MRLSNMFACLVFAAGVTGLLSMARADDALVASGPLKGWTAFKAPDGGFTVAFPEKPKTQKQQLPNADLHAYSHEAADAAYLVAYFDLPAGFALTLDRSASAYAMGRKGKIATQKRIRVGGNPGLEFTVKLPNNKISRVRLIEAGQRRFQVVVEGSSEVIDSEKANGFLDSFKLNRE